MTITDFNIRWYDGLQYVALLGLIAVKFAIFTTSLMWIPIEYVILAFLVLLGIFCACFYRWLRDFAVLRRTDIHECRLDIKGDKCDIYINDVYTVLIESVVWRDVDKPVLYPVRGCVVLPRKQEVQDVEVS